ncbi:MAG: hypothetical protein IJZ67_01860 [Alistipes sp.]|nr:hypothetical protein [Alistipes sp.]
MKSKNLTYTLAVVAAVWSILVFILFDFLALLAVIITLAAVWAGYAIFGGRSADDKLLQQQQKQIAQLQSKIQALNAELKGELAGRAALEAKIGQIEQQCTLENRFRRTLVSYQRLDDMLRYLEANDSASNFCSNARMAIDEVFCAYGYNFVDYSEQNKNLYECEYQSIASQKVVLRAIVRSDGELAVKGKVFLPIE